MKHSTRICLSLAGFILGTMLLIGAIIGVHHLQMDKNIQNSAINEAKIGLIIEGTPSSFSISGGKPGDVNCDGKVTEEDYIYLQKALNHEIEFNFDASIRMDIPEETLNADINADRIVNTIDLWILRKGLDGEIKYLSMYDYTPTYGDIDRNGVVDNEDLKKLNLYIEEKTTLDDFALKNADVNLDETINSKDIEMMQAYFDGKIVELPCRKIITEDWFFYVKEKQIYKDRTIEKNTIKFFLNPVSAIIDYVTKTVTKACEGVVNGANNVYNGICNFLGGLFK